MTLTDILNTQIWNGQSLADLMTLNVLTSFAGSLLGAVVMLILGFIVAGWARRRITKLGLQYEALDDTLFIFIGNIT
ncbi:MAG: mechanosensitive ion channel family protein, partial [Pseudomonadota bacterium]|nr:mechanosensitive ion channel family protein [Pseudomonadota bacterium]